jgi:hypothetical protein
MSTVKITELPDIPGGLNANTTNSIFLGVDVPTGVTGKFTATQLAERLYANNVLNVGDNTVILSNVIAQFSGHSNTFVQVNLENDSADGSADYVATADIGTDTAYYVDFGINNSQYAIKPLDGYVIVAGNQSANIGGNLLIGSITQGKNIDFALGGVENANVVGQFIYNTGFKLNKKPLIFADGTTQNTAAKSAQFSQDAFDTANNNATNITIIQGVNVTQNNSLAAINTYSISAYSQANAANNLATSGYAQANAANNLATSAYAKANAALANTSGTFAGDLNVTGTIKSGGIVTLNNSSFAINTAFLSIVASDDFAVVPPSNTNYMIHVTGKANSVTRVVLDSFGQNTYPLFAGRVGRGSPSALLPTQNNDVMLRFVGNGYTGTQFPGSSPSKIDFVAAENFSDTNRGTRIEFWNTPTGSNAIQQIASFNATDVTFTGLVNPTKGFIFTPRLPVGNQTTITIDFTNDVIIKANLAADLTVTLTNFVFGKVVEVWLTNTSGLTRTITHGCSSINSSENSTTFTMPSTSSAYLRYFSIDGNLANTFVAIQHA